MLKKTTDTLTMTSKDRHRRLQTNITDGQENKKADRCAFLIISATTHLTHLQSRTNQPHRPSFAKEPNFACPLNLLK